MTRPKGTKKKLHLRVPLYYGSHPNSSKMTKHARHSSDYRSPLVNLHGEKPLENSISPYLLFPHLPHCQPILQHDPNPRTTPFLRTLRSSISPTVPIILPTDFQSPPFAESSPPMLCVLAANALNEKNLSLRYWLSVPYVFWNPFYQLAPSSAI